MKDNEVIKKVLNNHNKFSCPSCEGVYSNPHWACTSLDKHFQFIVLETINIIGYKYTEKGKIEVVCPKCKNKFATKSKILINCNGCGKKFKKDQNLFHINQNKKNKEIAKL